MELDYRTILAEDDRRVTSAQFRGGTLTAVLAEVDLDLRGAEVTTSPAVLTTTIFLAEVDITVPDNWQIETRLSTPLCAFRDRRRMRGTDTENTAGPDLILSGIAMLAEVTLRD